jgi:hypothetical protein
MSNPKSFEGSPNAEAEEVHREDDSIQDTAHNVPHYPLRPHEQSQLEVPNVALRKY